MPRPKGARHFFAFRSPAPHVALHPARRRPSPPCVSRRLPFSRAFRRMGTETSPCGGTDLCGSDRELHQNKSSGPHLMMRAAPAAWYCVLLISGSCRFQRPAAAGGVTRGSERFYIPFFAVTVSAAQSKKISSPVLLSPVISHTRSLTSSSVRSRCAMTVSTSTSVSSMPSSIYA